MGLSIDCTTVLPLELREWDHEPRCAFGNISYGRFHAFRLDVARFYGVSPYARRWFGSRATLPTGGVTFWYHPDNEGEWTPGECVLVAELLRPYAAEASAYQSLAADLLAVLEHAGRTGGSLSFC